MYHHGHDSKEERAGKAKSVVDRACELHPDLPEAYVALGWYHYKCHRKYARALEAFHIAQRALYFADAYYTTELYLYETSIGGQTNHFHPDIYVNISQVAEKKVELIRCHESQCGGALDEHLLGDNKFRGREARVEYAEGFKPIHKMVGTRWERRSRYLLLDL